MDSLTTNTPAPTVGAQAAQQPTVTSIAEQQAQASSKRAEEEKAARFIPKAEKQTSKVMAELEKLQKLSNKKYYTYSQEQINELFGAIQIVLDEAKASFTDDVPEKKKRFTFTV